MLLPLGAIFLGKGLLRDTRSKRKLGDSVTGMLSLGGLDNEIDYYRPIINLVFWANGFWKDAMKVADLW